MVIVTGVLKVIGLEANPYCTVPATPEFAGRLEVETDVVATIVVKSEVDPAVIVVPEEMFTVDEPIVTSTGKLNVIAGVEVTLAPVEVTMPGAVNIWTVLVEGREKYGKLMLVLLPWKTFPAPSLTHA